MFINGLFGGPANFLKVHNNVMRVAGTGIRGAGTNLSFTDNHITPATGNPGSNGIAGNNGSAHFDNVLIRRNTISGFAGSGITGAYIAADIHENTISRCGGPGIDITNTSNGLSINDNVLSRCGLTTGPAVIFVENGTDKVGIRNNSYTGNTNNLDYFIWSVPNATLSGNITNTLLGNRIGP